MKLPTISTAFAVAKNAPATAVRFGNYILQPFLDKFVVLYIDDVLIYSKTLDEHYEHLRQVFRKLDEFQVYVHPEKCRLYMKTVTYLGIGVSSNGLEIQSHRKTAILDWPVP